jgi:imidazolonepropionase-like amidohydrolase
MPVNNDAIKPLTSCKGGSTGKRLWLELSSHLRRGVAGLLIFTCGLSSLALAQITALPDNQLMLKGGTIYTSPAEKPIRNGVVMIRDGRIVLVSDKQPLRVAKETRIVDCRGLTLVAGLWNSHVHFGERKWADATNIPASELGGQLQTMLTRYGFTSVFDLGSPWGNTLRIRQRIESGEVAGPRIRSTGEMLLGKGWMPADTIVRTLGMMLVKQPEVTNAAEALAASKSHLDSGTDGLKMYAAASFPPYARLPDEAIRAIVNEAHSRGKPVFAHPTSREGLLAAVRGGVDVLAHTTPQAGGPWDAAVITAMRQAKVAVIPTLKVWKDLLSHDRASMSEQWIQTCAGQLRAWLAAGGTILFGTDVGGAGVYDPGEEYSMMAEAGMSFRQILASLTTAPAERFGESARLGRIAKGCIADIVVINGDPARRIRAFADVRYTIRDGRIIYKAADGRQIKKPGSSPGHRR